MEEDKKVESEEKKEKIEIVSADLLNPFQTVNNNLPKVDKKEEIKVEEKVEEKKEVKKEVISTFNSLNKDIVKKENIQNINSNNVSSNDDEDNFYSNFGGGNTKNENNTIKKMNNSNTFNINNLNDSRPNRKSSVIFIILAIIGFGVEFLDGYFVFVGLGLCVISFIASIIMYRKLAKYALLSMILSFVLTAISIFLMITAYKELNVFKNKVNESLFKDSAVTYINAAITKKTINNDIVNCEGSNNIIKYSLDELKDYYEEKNFKLDLYNSYVLIEAVMENDECVLKQYIYITGDNYSLGTIENPVGSLEISTANINKK